MKQTHHVDLIVLGNGMLGHALVYYAQKKNLRIAWISKPERGVAYKAAAGMLTLPAEAEFLSQPLVEFSLEACKTYPEFIQSIEQESGIFCDFKQEGALSIALHHDHFNALKHLSERLKKLGLCAQELTKKEVSLLEPFIAPGQLGGLFSPESTWVNPNRLICALYQAIKKTSLIEKECNKAPRLVTQNNRVLGLECETFEIRAHNTILCTGAWPALDTFDNDVLGEREKRPIKGQSVLLKNDFPLATRIIRTPDSYIVPRANHEIFLGVTSEDVGFQDNNTAGGSLDVLAHGIRALPGLYESEVIEWTWGYRPVLGTLDPLVGPQPNIQGLWSATGHARHGIMLGPLSAKLLIDSICRDQVHPFIEPFSPKVRNTR